MACRNARRDELIYTEMFSLVIKYPSIRILLALLTEFDLELKQLDMKTSLHGSSDKTIYMT